MLWVLKRTVSVRGFFWAPKKYAKTDELENIYNCTLKNFVSPWNVEYTWQDYW